MQMPIPDESSAVQSRSDGSEAERSMTSEPTQKAEGASRSAADSSINSMRDDTRRERSSFSGGAALNAEIDRIRALLRAGQRDEAIESLRKLRRQHPDVVLPADLSALDG